MLVTLGLALLIIMGYLTVFWQHEIVVKLTENVNPEDDNDVIKLFENLEKEVSRKGSLAWLAGYLGIGQYLFYVVAFLISLLYGEITLLDAILALGFSIPLFEFLTDLRLVGFSFLKIITVLFSANLAYIIYTLNF